MLLLGIQVLKKSDSHNFDKCYLKQVTGTGQMQQNGRSFKVET